MRITRMSVDDWECVLDVVLKGAFLCTRAAVPHLAEQKYGRIINISSRADLGNPGQANYSAAKAGIVGFTRAMALENGRNWITVNAVAPGIISTITSRGSTRARRRPRPFRASAQWTTWRLRLPSSRRRLPATSPGKSCTSPAAATETRAQPVCRPAGRSCRNRWSAQISQSSARLCARPMIHSLSSVLRKSSASVKRRRFSS